MGVSPDSLHAEVPEPPWWTPTHQSARRTTLTRDAILAAALAVLDGEGFDRLSMRRVAEELGTGAASLYWHVAGKEQLLHMLVDRVVGEVALPPPDPTRWQEQLREFARDARAAFRRHPGIAQATLGQIPLGPNLIRIVEWLLDVLRSAGIPTGPAAWAGDLLALYVGAHGVEDAMHGDDPAEAERAAAATAAYLAALPPERFPQLTGAAAELAAGDADARFEFGLELLIRGLATFAEP